MKTKKRVSVAVRVRPILRDGLSHAHVQERFELEAVHRVGDTAVKVELQRQDELTRSSLFTFDYIFDQESTQLEVYEEAVVELIEAALSGSNATILAYGQTGSGKTFTVLGDVRPNPLENDLLTHDSGLFLRVLSELAEYKARQAKKGFHVVIGLSCVEIYNENIRDLFGGTPGAPPPQLKAVMIGDDVFLPSLIIKEMTSLREVFREIQLAISRRQSRSTESNSTSSRSHCLFFIDILQQADTAPPPPLSILADRKGAMTKEIKRVVTDGSGFGEIPFDGMVYRLNAQREPIFGSKIMLADLAGSEKIGKSGVSGEGLAEATFINSSLTALGNVVHSLHEGTFVSYRTSNLTRLLKATFNHPDSRVLLLSQVSPTQLTFDETVSTLHFANKVKDMKVTVTTGAEAERLQFDFIETQKVHDAILADLRIFQTEMESKSAFIRRSCRKNSGLYYSAATKNGARPSTKERRFILDNDCAVSFATKEYDIAHKEKKRKESQEKENFGRMVHEEAAKAVSAYASLMNEAREAAAHENEVSCRLNLQELQIASAGKLSAIQIQESTAFSLLLAQFCEENIVMRKKQIREAERKEEKISKELNVARLSAGEGLNAEDDEDDSKYALACWDHCAAKRFFAKLMELRELQMHCASLEHGCGCLEAWEKKNKEALSSCAQNGATSVGWREKKEGPSTGSD